MAVSTEGMKYISIQIMIQSNAEQIAYRHICGGEILQVMWQCSHMCNNTQL